MLTVVGLSAAALIGFATQGRLARQEPNRWTPQGRPEYLRQCVEMSLRRLAVDRIDLYYLHRVGPAASLADQLGVLQWNAYVRRVGEPDDHLGRFGQQEAVRRIVLAAAEAADRAVR
ncbi:MAG: pyridoxine 4-dehydrogenase [Actinoplanes sp.]|nr:pyridoxine 4-dehydrogenase [Actinoplanes sp.]